MWREGGEKCEMECWHTQFVLNLQNLSSLLAIWIVSIGVSGVFNCCSLSMVYGNYRRHMLAMYRGVYLDHFMRPKPPDILVRFLTIENFFYFIFKLDRFNRSSSSAIKLRTQFGVLLYKPL
jgi:hypothetical protein